jgi:cation diffusion facilitator CzcD-associated flavoprotein CzcO
MNKNQYEQIIVGAGFSGLCMGIKLKEKGMDNFVILERNRHLGGTWYDNDYPGAACDVESHLYSFSFEPNPDWSRQFGPQGEILHYMEHCAEKYKLTPHIRLNMNITKAVFDEKKGLWTVTAKSGETFTARILVNCSGGLSEPALPEIKGRDTFKGKVFHSARWDKSFDPKGKKVAVIGTGASAIQIVPAIVGKVKHLDLFQRTPPWILPKRDKEISAFRRKMYRGIPFMRKLYRARLYWTHELMAMGFVISPAILKLGGKIVIRYLNKSINNPELREKLTPHYTLGCKRVLLSNDYYPAMQQPNLSLITEGIKEITASGIKTRDGVQHDVDTIIFATGFQAAEGVLRYEVTGRGGLDLNESWRDGAEAYLGTSITGFPNMFIVVGPNTGLGHSSMILMIEAQVHYIMQALKTLKEKGAKYTDVKREVEKEYNDDLQARLAKSVWQTGGCASWYQTKSGKNVSLWPGFTFTFMRKTKYFEPDKYEWG